MPPAETERPTGQDLPEWHGKITTAVSNMLAAEYYKQQNENESKQKESDEKMNSLKMEHTNALKTCVDEIRRIEDQKAKLNNEIEQQQIKSDKELNILKSEHTNVVKEKDEEIKIIKDQNYLKQNESDNLKRDHTNMIKKKDDEIKRITDQNAELKEEKKAFNEQMEIALHNKVKEMTNEEKQFNVKILEEFDSLKKEFEGKLRTKDQQIETLKKSISVQTPNYPLLNRLLTERAEKNENNERDTLDVNNEVGDKTANTGAVATSGTHSPAIDESEKDENEDNKKNGVDANSLIQETAQESINNTLDANNETGDKNDVGDTDENQLVLQIQEDLVENKKDDCVTNSDGDGADAKTANCDDGDTSIREDDDKECLTTGVTNSDADGADGKTANSDNDTSIREDDDNECSTTEADDKANNEEDNGESKKDDSVVESKKDDADDENKKDNVAEEITFYETSRDVYQHIPGRKNSPNGGNVAPKNPKHSKVRNKDAKQIEFFACDKCSVCRFRTKTKLKEHKENKHPEDEKTLECAVCHVPQISVKMAKLCKRCKLLTKEDDNITKQSNENEQPPKKRQRRLYKEIHGAPVPFDDDFDITE
jgi:hypothetical protein